MFNLIEVFKLYENKYRFAQLVLLLGCLVVSVFGSTVSAATSSDTDSPYFIEGYDVVSYYKNTGPLLGNTKFKTEYDGKVMLFSSQLNMADFVANPDAYMPAYNGYCAYGMVYGMKSKIDPLQYDIVNGRLYLQLDRGTKRRWSRRVGRNIKRGNKAWGKLVTSIDDN